MEKKRSQSERDNSVGENFEGLCYQKTNSIFLNFVYRNVGGDRVHFRFEVVT